MHLIKAGLVLVNHNFVSKNPLFPNISAFTGEFSPPEAKFLNHLYNMNYQFGTDNFNSSTKSSTDATSIIRPSTKSQELATNKWK